jgi:hypothetical protein
LVDDTVPVVVALGWLRGLQNFLVNAEDAIDIKLLNRLV